MVPVSSSCENILHTHTLFHTLRHHEFEIWHTHYCLLAVIVSDWMAAVRSCWLRTCRKMSRHAQKSPITVWYKVLDKFIQSTYFLMRLPLYFQIILYMQICFCSSQLYTDNFGLKITRYWHKMQTILVENMHWGCSYFIVKRTVIVIATIETYLVVGGSRFFQNSGSHLWNCVVSLDNNVMSGMVLYHWLNIVFSFLV